MINRAEHILKHTFGYLEFRGAQREVIQTVLDGTDALVLMPTGGGKSLCYQIPGLVREGLAIVVSPLIALMQDQVNALQQLGIHAAYLNSSQSREQQNQVMRSLHDGSLDVLYVAPERLLLESTLNRLMAAEISLIAIDEAHCVSQWGHDFRADYLGLHILKQAFPGVPRLALTATADERTRLEIIDRLALSEPSVFVSSFDRPNIKYIVQEKGDAKAQLIKFLQEHRNHAGIVYCMTRNRVDGIAAWLQARGVKALPYHAGMSNEERAENQRRFLHEDSIVMVATIAFGMGIDKPDVRFVAHTSICLKAWKRTIKKLAEPAAMDNPVRLGWCMDCKMSCVWQRWCKTQMPTTAISGPKERRLIVCLGGARPIPADGELCYDILVNNVMRSVGTVMFV